jgi:hypothetical protein
MRATVSPALRDTRAAAAIPSLNIAIMPARAADGSCHARERQRPERCA